MELIKDKTYRFIVQVGSRVLYFTGKVISIENNFVSFIDKFNKTLSYNLNSVISFEELENGR